MHIKTVVIVQFFTKMLKILYILVMKFFVKTKIYFSPVLLC